MSNNSNKFRDKFSHFMQGRYGVDKYDQFLSVVAVILVILNIFLHSAFLWWLVVLLIIYIYFRMFSRNIARRYAENQKYMTFSRRFVDFFRHFGYNITHLKENYTKNKGYHIYRCPRCGQKIRIPKGKGHIIVKCPKCGFEFHKHS